MSFLKKLFGLGGGTDAAGSEAKPMKSGEHKGFTIAAAPFREGGQWQTAGVITREIDGTMKEHRFIRADRFGSAEEAADFALVKGRQIVDEQGERMFKAG
jgi:hypothetical protein